MILEYTVRRSPKRTKLSIIVERDCRVVVLAPDEASDSAIDSAVQAKRQWIYEKTRHEQKYQPLPHPPGKELVSGESALYLGRNYRIELIEETLDGVKFQQKFLVSRSEVKRGKEILREWYMKQASRKILPRTAKHARDLGVTYTNAKIVDSQFRWGSCTPKNSVHFNWRLIKAPMFVIDYVIIHELAHLIEPNHTARFWNVVRTQSPTADKARTWLKTNGQLLEEVI